MDDLFAHIRRFVPLEKEHEEVLAASFGSLSLKKKAHLLQEGQVCTANHFIRKGCCRMYMTDEAGNEQTILFSIENWWITDYFSLDSGKPSKFYIQAVENCELFVLEKSRQEDLFAGVPLLERYFRLLVQRAYSATMMRIQYIFTLTGEERYLFFRSLYPDFVQRVPQYMLASYLGFSPEFLSKIRAKNL